MYEMAARRVLWCCVLAGPPTVAAIAATQPRWALAAAVCAIPAVSGSALVLLLTAGQHAAARTVPGERTRQLLWAGIPVAALMIAVAAAERLRVLDYTGTVLLLTCPAALTLRWWFSQRIPRQVEMKVDEIEQDVTSLRAALLEAYGYAGRPWDGGTGFGGQARRHLRPVRRLRPAHPVSADTGPHRTVLGGAAQWLRGGHGPAELDHRPADTPVGALVVPDPLEERVVPLVVLGRQVVGVAGQVRRFGDRGAQEDLFEDCGRVGAARGDEPFRGDVQVVSHVRDMPLAAGDLVVVAVTAAVAQFDLGPADHARAACRLAGPRGCF